MKPIDSKESAKRWRFASPHDTFVNHDQALRIARRRWKRNRSKYLRRKAKRQTTTLEDEHAHLFPDLTKPCDNPSNL